MNAITTSSLAARIERAARMSTTNVGADVGTAWHCIRNAFIRATRRELGLPRHGPAPDSVYLAANKYAGRIAGGHGFIEAYSRALPMRTLRRLVRRARKGTL